MAVRPLTFGMHYREKGRSVRVRANHSAPERYVVEVERDSKTTREDYPSLSWALRAFANSWRNRLN